MRHAGALICAATSSQRGDILQLGVEGRPIRTIEIGGQREAGEDQPAVLHGCFNPRGGGGGRADEPRVKIDARDAQRLHLADKPFQRPFFLFESGGENCSGKWRTSLQGSFSSQRCLARVGGPSGTPRKKARWNWLGTPGAPCFPGRTTVVSAEKVGVGRDARFMAAGYHAVTAPAPVAGPWARGPRSLRKDRLA